MVFSACFGVIGGSTAVFGINYQELEGFFTKDGLRTIFLLSSISISPDWQKRDNNLLTVSLASDA